MVDGAPRRSRRLVIGLAVLALWAAGLGLLARRELLRPMSARLAEAALQVQPSSHYYVVERDGQVVGGASAQVDTTGYGFVFREQLFGALLEGDDDSVTVRARASYTPTLGFGGFRIEVERGRDSIVLNGQRTGDSLIAITLEGLGGPPVNHQVAAADPIFLPATAPLQLFLLHKPARGLESTVTVFDPLLQRARTLPLRVARDSVLVVVDSAAFDSAVRRWVPARQDTLRAWLVTSDSTTMTAWVDRAGSIVEITDGRGTRAVRTAYEIAFQNWRLAREAAGGGRE